LGWIPGESLSDLQWAKWHCGMFFLQYFNFLCQSMTYQCYYALIIVPIIRGKLQPIWVCGPKRLFVTHQCSHYHYRNMQCRNKNSLLVMCTNIYHNYYLHDMSFPTHPTSDKWHNSSIFCFIYALYKRDMNIISLHIQCSIFKCMEHCNTCALMM
jgi:hypothetical protein